MGFHIGQMVRYWKGIKRGEPSGQGRICYGPQKLNDSGPDVVWIETCSGCISITHIEKVNELEAEK